MNQEELRLKNELTTKKIALETQIEAIKLLNDPEYDGQIEGLTNILKAVKTKLETVIKEASEREANDIQAAQEAKGKRNKENLKLVHNYFKHISKLKPGERPDGKIYGPVKRLKGNGPVIRILKLYGLKLI